MFRLNINMGPVYTVKEHLSVEGTCLHSKCSFTVYTGSYLCKDGVVLSDNKIFTIMIVAVKLSQ